ncbi:hypothetical protein GCK72_004109 [Caenorhabditis remanei]|uniref:DUF38 domain-containing protein n=1 Tax=Caenorhabditis remanei TaxID=31234 RepID=E3NL61_CAERE|nr:hypothetical protein GCK72_004109 [Caenorhabditis remanei]EFP04180.1 hypothetical protein CRE_12350 [Caenorhabditis remanei]KAF1764162.1 hypothetical protein GCK72_004109 [Caenorhabditis remanei]
MSRPLFYETAKCVAIYLDPNLRLELNQRCPSFRCIHEAAQSIRIRNLKINSASFTINETTYRLGVLRKYLFENAPQSITDANAEGGIQYDVDKYGIPVIPDGAQTRGEGPGNEEILRRLKGDVLKMERWGGEGRPDYAIELEKRKLEILSYEMRMGNQFPPFDQFLHLTVTSDGNGEKLEILNYNQTLTKARNYLLKKILCVHGKVIIENIDIEQYVNYCTSLPLDFSSDFYFTPWKPYQRQIVRSGGIRTLLQYPLSIQADKLEVGSLTTPFRTLSEVLSILNGFLSKDVFPARIMKKLLPPIPNYRMREIHNRTTEFLCINEVLPLSVLLSITNDRVHLDYCSFVEEDFAALVRSLNDVRSPVGTYYSIGFFNAEKIPDFFNGFGALPGARRVPETRLAQHRESIVIPMVDDKELNVCCMNTGEEDEWYCGLSLIVKIKVQMRGTTQVN